MKKKYPEWLHHMSGLSYDQPIPSAEKLEKNNIFVDMAVYWTVREVVEDKGIDAIHIINKAMVAFLQAEGYDLPQDVIEAWS